MLNDNDGSLTGLLADTQPVPRETLSINEDPFYRAPKVVPECASDKHYGTDFTGQPATAITSPYEYVSTAIIPDCGLRSVLESVESSAVHPNRLPRGMRQGSGWLEKLDLALCSLLRSTHVSAKLDGTGQRGLRQGPVV